MKQQSLFELGSQMLLTGDLVVNSYSVQVLTLKVFYRSWLSLKVKLKLFSCDFMPQGSLLKQKYCLLLGHQTSLTLEMSLKLIDCY